MSGTLSGTTLSALAPVLQAVTGAAGTGSTIFNLWNQAKNQEYQDKLRSYAQDPAKMNAYATQFTKPLTAGLQTSVANQAQADLATRGLTDSPEISQQVYAQAIAPYIQQNQQVGYQDALQALGLGGGAVNPNTQSANSISALAKAFSQLPNAGSTNGASALTRLLQLAQPGAAPVMPQTQSPDLGDSGSVPYQPTQSFDFSSYQPDYAAAADTGGYTSE